MEPRTRKDSCHSSIYTFSKHPGAVFYLWSQPPGGTEGQKPGFVFGWRFVWLLLGQWTKHELGTEPGIAV